MMKTIDVSNEERSMGLEIYSESILESKTYSLHFKKDGFRRGYANFTLVPSLGIVHAQTDWGDYCHRWGNIGQQSLEEFLLDLDKGYVATKFCGSEKELDDDKTKSRLLADILATRRRGKISSDTARELYEEVTDNIDFDVNIDAFCAEFPYRIIDVIYDGDYCSIPITRCYTGWQKVFVEEVFPAFQKYLKEKGVKDGGL
jgi:hypothetical protein